MDFIKLQMDLRGSEPSNLCLLKKPHNVVFWLLKNYPKTTIRDVHSGCLVIHY